jgi:hypothetical protein
MVTPPCSLPHPDRTGGRHRRLARPAGSSACCSRSLRPPRIGRLTLTTMPLAAAFLAWRSSACSGPRSSDRLVGDPDAVALFVIAVLVADVVVHDPTMSASCGSTARPPRRQPVGSRLHRLRTRRGGPAAALQNQNPAQFAGVLLPALIFGLYEVLNGDRRFVGGAIALITTAGSWSRAREERVSVAIVFVASILPRCLRRLLSATALLAVILVATVQIPGVSSLSSSVSRQPHHRRAPDGHLDCGADHMAPPRSWAWAMPTSRSPTRDQPIIVNPRRRQPPRCRPHNLAVGTLIELGPVGLAVPCSCCPGAQTWLAQMQRPCRRPGSAVDPAPSDILSNRTVCSDRIGRRTCLPATAGGPTEGA